MRLPEFLRVEAIVRLFGLRKLRRFVARFSFNRMGSKGRLVTAEGSSVQGRATVGKLVTIESGEENLIEIGKGTKFHGTVDFNGKGNLVQIGAGSKMHGDVRFSGHGNKLLIGDNCRYRGRIFIKGSGQTVLFGDHSTAGDVYILCAEGADVRIGTWCMFSRRIEIRTTDAHSIIDRKTRKRMNPASSIIIGDHVWIGVGAIVNKGAVVPADSIVGAMSFVNGKFAEEGVVLAGTPAKVVKSGITWHRAQKPKYSAAQVDHWKA